MSKAVKEVENAVKNPVKTVEKVVNKTVIEPAKNVYHAGKNIVTGTGHLIAGHSEEAKKDYSEAVNQATQAAVSYATGGTANVVAPKLLDKTGEAVGKATVAAADSLMQPTVDTLRSVGHVAEAGYDVLKGDFKEAGKNIAKATGEITAAGYGSMTLGLGKVATPKLMNITKEFGKMVGSYSTGNFNEGSQSLENITGWDVDNSIAEDRERAAQAAYQAEVDAANAAAERNRRANLLSLRKSLTPSLSRASQGGTGGSMAQTIKGLGGIVLG